MEKLAYQEVVSKEINELKKVYFSLDFKDRLDEAHALMRHVHSKEEIKSMIKKNHLEEFVYLSLKKLGDESKTKEELENSLIYMNLFLEDTYVAKQIYFKKLATLILSHQKFGIIIEDYCLLRHLMSLEEIEAYFFSLPSMNIYSLIKIYLLEQCFDKLTPYVDVLRGSDLILPYQNAIHYHNPSLYKALFKSKKHHHFNPLWRLA